MHLAAWEASLNNAALTALAAVADGILTPQGANRFIVPAGVPEVKWAAAMGTTIARAQIVTPSLLSNRVSAEVHPRRQGVAFSLLAPEIFIPFGRMPLAPSETIEFDAANAGGGAEVTTALVELGPTVNPPVPDGIAIIARGTGTKTLVANAWTLTPLTLDYDLPAGNYALVGFCPISANAVAARAVVIGQQWRPGGIGLKGTEATGADFSASWGMKQTQGYDMGHFNNLNVPQFEFLSAAADTAETVYMYIIKLPGA